MKKKRYTEDQIFKILKEGDSGTPINDVCRKYCISNPTFFRSQSKYSGMDVSELKKMKGIEA